MRSLFLRLFIWFGLAMVLVNVASFATGIFAERRFQPPRNNPIAQMSGLMAQTAVETFETGGQQALRSYLSRLETASNVRAVLLNDRGEELSGQSVSENLKPLASRVTSSSPFVFQPESEGRGPRPASTAQLVESTAGVNYTFLARFPPPDFPRPPRMGEPGSFWFALRVGARTLLPLLLVGGLFCYLLARSLSKPIEQLRSTTHELSAGNLGARVEPTLLKRRDEIGELGRDFNSMAGHIESLVAAQRRLLADISHELRSPLARQGVAIGLARRKGNPEVMPSIDRISREATRMNEMIGQLLDLTQVESGTESITKGTFDLGKLLEVIVQDADYEACDNNRSVRILESHSCEIQGVQELLGSAIENVVRNAVRHTAPETEVTVSLTSEQKNGTRNALIKVRDYGSGVDESALKDIFRPFYRVEDARDRKSGGTGLGLAIATRAIELHGGKIAATNVEGGGLQVEIRLPVSVREPASDML
jgi:two-component system, OmpR family, sensor histidine kinase CpxA